MASVNLTRVQVLDNPSMFTNPLQFEIEYECLQTLQDDLEWKLTYVGSAESDEHDQVLDSVLVGPVNVGSYRFVFQADPPNWDTIPQGDLLGVTIILLTCSYRKQAFIQVGYYVNNDYIDEALRDEPPAFVDITRVQRNILAEKPRVTRWQIEFDAPMPIATPDQQGGAGEVVMGGAAHAQAGSSMMGGEFTDSAFGGAGAFGDTDMMVA